MSEELTRLVAKATEKFQSVEAHAYEARGSLYFAGIVSIYNSPREQISALFA